MVSSTQQTSRIRRRKATTSGKSNKRERRISGTPAFTIHPEGYDPKAADAKPAVKGSLGKALWRTIRLQISATVSALHAQHATVPSNRLCAPRSNLLAQAHLGLLRRKPKLSRHILPWIVLQPRGRFIPRLQLVKKLALLVLSTKQLSLPRRERLIFPETEGVLPTPSVFLFPLAQMGT